MRTDANARKVVFERLVQLCRRGASPILCADGRPPKEKRQTLRDRFEQRHGYAGGGASSAVSFATLSDQCREIAASLGIPTISKSRSEDEEAEGEARCAALCAAGFADAVISEDVDALVLYEAPLLIRNVEFKQHDAVSFELINLQAVKTKLHLNMKGSLAALSLLLGTDYGR